MQGQLRFTEDRKGREGEKWEVKADVLSLLRSLVVV